MRVNRDPEKADRSALANFVFREMGGNAAARKEMRTGHNGDNGGPTIAKTEIADDET